MSKDDKTVAFSMRMSRKTYDQLRAAVKKHEHAPYPTNMTRIVDRGVHLALRELKEMQHTGSSQ